MMNSDALKDLFRISNHFFSFILFLSLVQGSSHDLRTLAVREGDKIELDCNHLNASHPQKEIFWYKYGIPLQDISYRTFGTDVLKSSKLTFDNLLFADSGNYSCHLNNTMSSVHRIFMVQVHESSKQPPVINLLSNSTAILGNEADLHCHVTSHSVTYIRWYFKTPAAKLNSSNSGTREDLIEISSILPIKIFSYYQESKLNSQPYKLEAVVRVHNVSFADQGEYICEAFNEHGKARHVAFLNVIKGSNPSADGFEATYGALSGQSQKLPLAMLIVVPAAFLVVLTAVFVRALEKTKQKHPFGLKADKSENEVVSILNNQCPCQEGDKETAISDPQWISKFTKHDGFERTGQQTVPLAKKVTCDVVPCLCDSVTSSGLSDVVSGDFVGSKRCSEVLELEWDGIDLVMDEGFEAIKLCKEEEV